MIKLIKYTEKKEWNDIVNSFPNKDVYFEWDYSRSFMENEKGTPYLIYYTDGNNKLCYPIFERDIADFYPFTNILDKGLYYDWSTPYGYGGPLASKDRLSNLEQEAFKCELYQLANKRKVVTQFIRFHPFLQNQNVCDNVIENLYVKDTIFINLEDDLMLEMESKNRNLIRKALKNNIVIIHDQGEKIDEFMNIYKETMDRDHAKEFYYFPKSYYEFMNKAMKDKVEYFYAYKDDLMIAASIFFYDDKVMHYHLSGNLTNYRTFAPSNLLLYTASLWGKEKGLTKLHLGGGVGVEDSLFHFKKQFNKNGRISFYIGRNIFNQDKYNELLNIRQKNENSFDKNNDYYIKYRLPIKE